jgi:hypothetical protein
MLVVHLLHTLQSTNILWSFILLILKYPLPLVDVPPGHVAHSRSRNYIPPHSVALYPVNV